MAYAVQTDVPVERTRTQIEALVAKFGCSKFMTGIDRESRSAVVQFKAQERIVRFTLALPHPEDYLRRGRTDDRAFAQAERSKWRALLLVIKAKLEAVESQIATFEEEFLAHIVMPNDRTVGQVMTPMITEAYRSGKMPTLLLPGATTEEAR